MFLLPESQRRPDWTTGWRFFAVAGVVGIAMIVTLRWWSVLGGTVYWAAMNYFFRSKPDPEEDLPDQRL